MDEPVTVIFVVSGPDIMAISRVQILKFIELVSIMHCTITALYYALCR
jgi:hypothetical protein